MLIDSSNVNNGKTVNGRKAIGEFNSTKGEIVLDIGSDNVVATALHEVTHYAKINAPTQYNALRDAVLEHTTKPGKMKYYLEKYSNTYRTNNVHEITEEMTADAAEALLTNEKFIDELFNDKDFINAVVGENKGFVRKFLDTLHDIISSIKDYLKGRTVNHQIARELSEDVKALEKIEKLWRDALTAAVNNHAEISNAKENTDTQSSGGVKYSKAEKNALTKEEYKRATAAFMNGDTSAIIEDCAIRVTNKNDVYKIKIVCYNLSDDGFDFQITEVYQIENYDYNIHSENEDPAVIIAKGVRDGYTQREIEALLQNNKFDDGQIFKRFSPQSGRYYRLKKSTGRGERVSGGKSSGSGLSEETEQSETESKLKFSLSEPVEEKDNLIAVHNIYTDKLAKSLKLGGFPMPSTVVSKPDMSKVSDIDIEAYKNFSTKEAKKPIRRIAEMLGIHNVNYKNSNIEFDFGFSKKNLDVSLHHQSEYGGNYADYVEMLTCLDKLVENAELIEVHENYKDDEQLKRTFVLISALNSKDGIYPVQFEVKEFYSSTKKLYLTAVLTKIKEPAVVTESHTDYSEASTPLVADSAISLSQLFANVNHTDKRFLKYVPDNFLSTEQIEAKREAQKSDYKNYNRYVEVFENDKNGGDNKFSLSEPVEEKDNLIAVHNIYTDKLAKSLKLGGFPMPSIVVSKPDMSKVSDIDIEAYKNFSTKEAKKPIRRIAEMLGIHNVNYKNSNIEFDFGFSKKNLDVSLHHQSEYGGNYADYVEMLTCLDKLVENAELIEVHENYKDDEQLKRTFVLISALNSKDGIYPVQFEVKEFYSSTKKLYLTAVLTKIKEPAVVTESHTDYSEASTPLVADSAISLSQLFANVNHTDKRFLKYVPDNFLSTEQIEAKREAQKSDYKNHNRYIEVFENVEKSGSSSKYSESAGKGNVLPDDANQSNSTDNKAVINNNDIRYSLAVDDAQAKKDGRYKKGTNYHGLGATAVKEIYEKLSNPIAVIAADNSKYISQRVIAFADLSINGKQVIAPIEVYAEISQGSDTIDANLIVSYYDKNNISNMLSKALALEANNQVGFYYLDKKRAQSLLVPLGLQLPPQPNNVGSNIIIRHISSNVNRKIDTVLKSRQFIRWFGGFVVLVELRSNRLHF